MNQAVVGAAGDVDDDQIREPEGLLVSTMTRAQQIDLTRTILTVFSGLPQSLPQLRLHVDYAPAAGYLWHPAIPETTARSADAFWGKWPMVAGKSAEATLAAARRYDPAAPPGDIRPSLGALNVALLDASGPVWQYGGPAVAIRNPSPAPAPGMGQVHGSADLPVGVPREERP